jgi:hypothetical protein
VFGFVVEIPPYFLATNEPLSVEELSISNIIVEAIEEVIDPETAELPIPEQVEGLDIQALVDASGGDLEKASKKAFQDKPREFSAFEIALKSRMEAMSARLAKE